MKKLIFVILFCSGCTIYKQPVSIPKERTATIISSGNGLYIYKVDGQNTNFFSGFGIVPDRLILTKGRHTFRIQVRWTSDMNTQYLNLWLEAEEGKTYQLVKNISGYKTTVWFEETETKAVSGGICDGNKCLLN